MEVQKIIINTEPVPIEVTGITLMTAEEYKKYGANISSSYGWWWLRSPGYRPYFANAVFSSGAMSINNYVDREYGSVRPVLIGRMVSAKLKIGDKFELAGHTWTILSDDLALCDEAVGETCYRKDSEACDANVYEKSDVKEWLNNWAKENGIII